MMGAGTQRFGLNTDYDKVLDIRTRLRLCAEAGFTDIHWCEDLETDELYDAAFVRDTASLLKDMGLGLLDMHGPASAERKICSDETDTRELGIRLLANRIETVRQLGGDSVVLHPAAAGAPALARTFDAVDRLTGICAGHRVVLALEAADAEAAGPYFERYPPETMGYCFDAGHCYIRKPPTLNLLEQYAERLCVTHLHDNYGTEDDHRLPFDGTLPWERVAKTLARIAYAKPLCLEIGRHSYLAGTYDAAEPEMPVAEFLARAYERARRLAEMATPALDGRRQPQPAAPGKTRGEAR